MKKQPKIKYPIFAKAVLKKDEYIDIKNGDTVLLLGEITNMPGHVVLVKSDDTIGWGYHKESFKILTEEEV